VRNLRATPVSHQVTDGDQVDCPQEEAVRLNLRLRRQVTDSSEEGSGDDGNAQPRLVTGAKLSHQNDEEEKEEEDAVGPAAQRDKDYIPADIHPVQGTLRNNK
jgi:hypothetical protein